MIDKHVKLGLLCTRRNVDGDFFCNVEIAGRNRDAIKEKLSVTSRCMPFEQEHIADTCVCCGKPATKMVYWGRAY